MANFNFFFKIKYIFPSIASNQFYRDQVFQEIAPGEQGSINVAYLIPEADPRYGTLRDALEVRVDGRTNAIRTDK